MSAATGETSDGNGLSQYKILGLAFNQDCTALSMGTMKTYALFSINVDKKSQDNLECDIEPVTTITYLPYKEVRIIERLFSSSLIVIVSNDEPRKLRLCHFLKGVEIFQKLFPTTILTVKLNRSRLILCLEESIYIFDLRNMETLHRIHEIPLNPEGLCALSINETYPYLAYPASTTSGEIQVFDTMTKAPKILIPAHDGPLVAISFDMSGTKIATASNRGTVIRVHSVLDGTCISEFRRGRWVATIYSLVFSPDSLFLAVSSSSGTIHIFRLPKPVEQSIPEANTWINTFGNTLGYVGSYLPKQASEMLTQDRSFATVHLQSTTTKTIIAMNIINKKLVLFVAGYDGVVLAYEVNTEEGGECKQFNRQLLFNVSEKPLNQQNSTEDAQAPNLFESENKRRSSSSTKS